MGKSAGGSIGTGYRAPEELAADPELVDEPIRPLVQALNETGWARTVFSCAGHPEEPDSIKRGRRQAHIDLLVDDLARWQAFIRSLPRVPGIRTTEGALGQVPAWLELEGAWHYRRLVFEPAPYDMPTHRCRGALDTALTAATSALRSPDPHTSHADTR